MEPSPASAPALTHGFRLWYATTAGIGLWLVHLTTLASLVNVTCEHPWVEWIMHGTTVGLAIATLLALRWCRVLIRESGGEDDEANNLAGRLRFMGWFGGLIELISLLLILAEGAYVLVIDPCG